MFFLSVLQTVITRCVCLWFVYLPAAELSSLSSVGEVWYTRGSTKGVKEAFEPPPWPNYKNNKWTISAPAKWFNSRHSEKNSLQLGLKIQQKHSSCCLDNRWFRNNEFYNGRKFYGFTCESVNNVCDRVMKILRVIRIAKCFPHIFRLFSLILILVIVKRGEQIKGRGG